MSPTTPIFEFTLTRTRSGPAGTFGTLSDTLGAAPFHTLEPPIESPDGRKNVPNICAIPPGTYSLSLIWVDHFHRLIPLLNNVPGRSQILMHTGATVADTKGCIMLGHGVEGDTIVDTLTAVEDFTRLVADEQIGGNQVVLNVVDAITNAAPVTP